MHNPPPPSRIWRRHQVTTYACHDKYFFSSLPSVNSTIQRMQLGYVSLRSLVTQHSRPTFSGKRDPGCQVCPSSAPRDTQRTSTFRALDSRSQIPTPPNRDATVQCSPSCRALPDARQDNNPALPPRPTIDQARRDAVTRTSRFGTVRTGTEHANYCAGFAPEGPGEVIIIQ